MTSIVAVADHILHALGLIRNTAEAGTVVAVADVALGRYQHQIDVGETLSDLSGSSSHCPPDHLPYHANSEHFRSHGFAPRSAQVRSEGIRREQDYVKQVNSVLFQRHLRGFE